MIVPYLSSLSLTLFDDFCSFLLFYLFFFCVVTCLPTFFSCVSNPYKEILLRKIPAGQRQRGMGEPLGGLGEPNSEFGHWGHGLSFCHSPPNIDWTDIQILPRWWLKNYFLFSPLPGEDSYFGKYFSTGLKPPTSYIIFNISTHALERVRDCLRGLADERRRLVGPRSSLF